MKNQKNKGWTEDKEEILTEKGVERKAPIHRKVAMKDKYSTTLHEPLFPYNARSKDENEDEELAEEIVEEVQENRKPSAIAKDSSRTAEKVGDKEDADDLVDWMKNPNKSDLKDVDTNEDENED